MKKYFKVILVLFAVMSIIGCKNKSELVKVCTFETSDMEGKYVLNSKYEIYGTNDIVDKVIVTEIITSSDKETLNHYEESFKAEYENYSNLYGAHINKIAKKENQVISKTTINYKKMNIDAYISDNTLLKDYTKDNKISIDGRVRVYEELGAVCE